MRTHARSLRFAPGLALVLGAAIVGAAGWHAASFADGFHSVLMGYKHIYDYWKANKDKLGFGDTEGTYEDDLDARLAGMMKRMGEIQTALAGVLTAAERQKLTDELTKLRQESAPLSPPVGFGGTRAQRRRAFMSELVKGMEYINSYNVRPKEFPTFSRDYNGELNGIAKVFKEIGEPAAEYVWDAVRNEVRFGGVDGAREKRELEKQRLYLTHKIQKLAVALPAQTDPEKQKLAAEEMQKLNKELSDVNLKLGDHDTNGLWGAQGLRRNQDFVRRMEAVLVDMGADAAPALATDLGHANAHVVKEAAELLRRIGMPAVPALVLQLTIKGRETAAAEVLKRLACRDFGTDAERWKEFFRSKGVRFPSDPDPNDKPAAQPGPPGPPAPDPQANDKEDKSKEKVKDKKVQGEDPAAAGEAKQALMKKLFGAKDAKNKEPDSGADATPTAPKKPADGLTVEEDDANKISDNPAAWSGKDLEIAPRE